MALPNDEAPQASSLGRYHLIASLGSAAGSWPALDQARLQQSLEQYTKRPLTELFGCHFGSTYTVRNVPPLCAP